MSKTLKVGMIGYRFMGKAHSNGWRQAPHFFPLKADLEMHTICGRNREALEDPYQVNQDPYGKGWLCVIECKDWETESKHLITGEAVEAWSEKEMERYRSQGWID